MVITFTLGFVAFVAAVIVGVLVWVFIMLYKLKKKFNWMIGEWKKQSEYQNALYTRIMDVEYYVQTNFVAKEDLKDNKKTLLKG